MDQSYVIGLGLIGFLGIGAIALVVQRQDRKAREVREKFYHDYLYSKAKNERQKAIADAIHKPVQKKATAPDRATEPARSSKFRASSRRDDSLDPLNPVSMASPMHPIHNTHSRSDDCDSSRSSSSYDSGSSSSCDSSSSSCCD